MEQQKTGSESDKEALLKFMQDAECLDALSKWTNDFNIFDVLKISRTEIRHSNLLSWLIDPNENHGLGDSFLYGIIVLLSKELDQKTALHLLSSDLYSYNVFREWNHIDILLISNQNRVVLAIENKVGAHEHNSGNSEESQLITYKNKITSQYYDYKKIYIYLTPDGEEPSDNDWITLNYSDVVTVLEKVYSSKANQLGSDVSLLIKNYIDNIKKNITMDQELINLCNSIYNKHRRALDLIFENRDDVVSQISNNCKSIIEQIPGVTFDNSSKSKKYLKFRTTGLNDAFQGIDPKYYYYQFEIDEKHITVMLEYHKEKAEQLDDEIYETMMEFRKKFKFRAELTKPDWVWYRVWTHKTDNVYDENWIKERIKKIMDIDGSSSLNNKKETE